MKKTYTINYQITLVGLSSYLRILVFTLVRARARAQCDIEPDFSCGCVHSFTHPDTMKTVVFLVALAVAAVTARTEITASGLSIEYLNQPDTCQRPARRGDTVSVHYTGTLQV